MKRALLIPFLAAFVFAAPSWAVVFKLPAEAVKEVFPEATEVVVRNVILTSKQVLDVERISKLKIHDRLISFYLGKKGNEALGFAVFDTFIIRTQPATFLLVMDKEGKVKNIETIAFYEPLEYLPPQKWLNLIKGKELNGSLRLKVGVRNITGATISARTVMESVRKNLAIYKVVFGENGP